MLTLATNLDAQDLINQKGSVLSVREYLMNIQMKEKELNNNVFRFIESKSLTQGLGLATASWDGIPCKIYFIERREWVSGRLKMMLEFSVRLLFNFGDKIEEDSKGNKEHEYPQGSSSIICNLDNRDMIVFNKSESEKEKAFKVEYFLEFSNFNWLGSMFKDWSSIYNMLSITRPSNYEILKQDGLDWETRGLTISCQYEGTIRYDFYDCSFQMYSINSMNDEPNSNLRISPLDEIRQMINES